MRRKRVVVKIPSYVTVAVASGAVQAAVSWLLHLLLGS